MWCTREKLKASCCPSPLLGNCPIMCWWWKEPLYRCFMTGPFSFCLPSEGQIYGARQSSMQGKKKNPWLLHSLIHQRTHLQVTTLSFLWLSQRWAYFALPSPSSAHSCEWGCWQHLMRWINVWWPRRNKVYFQAGRQTVTRGGSCWGKISSKQAPRKNKSDTFSPNVILLKGTIVKSKANTS